MRLSSGLSRSPERSIGHAVSASPLLDSELMTLFSGGLFLSFYLSFLLYSKYVLNYSCRAFVLNSKSQLRKVSQVYSTVNKGKELRSDVGDDTSGHYKALFMAVIDFL